MRIKRIEDRGWRTAPEQSGVHRARLSLSSILYLLSSFLFTTAPGCAVAGVVAHKVVGNPSVPAQYQPAKEPMLVLVENYRNPDAVGLDAQRISLHVVDQLRRYRVAPVVDPDAVEALRSQPDFHAMKVEEVGRAAGAAQVLYVNLQSFSVDDTVGGEMMKGRAEMRVRVVDVASGHTRWPRSVPEGHTVSGQTQWVRSTVGSREGASEPELRDQVARVAADQIVKLFRKWNPDDEEHDLEETVR